MNKDLAVKFLRLVNETGMNGWGQVYARMPFEVGEESVKGALFGAVFAKGENVQEKETEMMVWVDEYYNEVKNGGVLGDFWEKFRNKFPDTDSVWAWITKEKGKRVIRMVRIGESGVMITRNDNNVEIQGAKGEGKIIIGEIKTKDRILVWAGSLEKYLKDLSDSSVKDEEKVDGVVEKLINNKECASGLILSFDESEDLISETDTGIIGEERVCEEVKKNEYKPYIKTEDEVEIVTDRLVGPVRTKDKIINFWKEIGGRRGRIIVGGRGRVGNKKKFAVILGVLFLFLLSGSVLMGTVKIRRDRDEAKWVAFFEPIEKKRLEAENLTKINVVGSKKILEEARMAFDEGKGEFLSTSYQVKVADLEKALNLTWQTTSGEKTSEIVNRINFDLVRQGFKGTKMTNSVSGSFLVLDANMGVVASAETEQKEIKIIAGKGENNKWIDVVPYKKTGYVLNRQGIGVIAYGEVIATDFDSAVVNPVSLGIFGNSLYLLDSDNREIYKYAIGSEVIGERQRWLKQDEEIEITTPVDMAIDGDVWVVGDMVKVEKFRRGAKENFSLSGMPKGSEFSKIAVEKEGNRGALLDKVHGYIVLFNKEDGAFLTQLNTDEFREASDIEFDEGRLWVLTGGMMIEVR